jgi:regulator of sigma E protease
LGSPGDITLGLCLIFAAWSWGQAGLYALYALEVIIGLGLVIFVHELGHFVVAKLCGVKCEKFYLGFDIAGLKLLKFRRGETEYGIGILPFGGYVKMLGQEDNPARLREELERAKAQQAGETAEGSAPPSPAGSESVSSQSEGEPIDIEAAERALYDPRSYLAQSVPERMAIISAGVVMNVLFALLTGMLAYTLGVRQFEPTLGAISPGEAAWKANLQVGDQIVSVAGQPADRFSDLQRAVSLGDIEDGVPIVVRRPGVEEPITLRLAPDQKRGAPTVGIGSGATMTLRGVEPATPAALASPRFQSGDRIVAADGKPLDRYEQLHAYLAHHPGQSVAVTVERPNQDGSVARVTIPVAPQPMWEFGIVMRMGPITAIQDGSPAQAAGLMAGDEILAVEGQPVGDPVTLPERLRVLALDRSVANVQVRRPGSDASLDLKVGLRKADGYYVPMFTNNPLAVPAMGVAYQPLTEIQSIVPDSPAAKAGLAPGDKIVGATLVRPPADRMTEKELGMDPDEVQLKFRPIEFEERKWTWAAFTYSQFLPGMKVEMRLADGRKVTLEPVRSQEWFRPDRGFEFQPLSYVQTAGSAGEAMRLGASETWDSLTLVFRSVQKVSTGQVSPKMLGGPVEIVKQAVGAAAQGLSPLLMFLTLIGANLAVLNFLPIPVLDGGHMMFLIYEGVTGKPPNERVHLALSYLGLFLILALMVFVLGLDFGLISRH